MFVTGITIVLCSCTFSNPQAGKCWFDILWFLCNPIVKWPFHLQTSHRHGLFIFGSNCYLSRYTDKTTGLPYHLALITIIGFGSLLDDFPTINLRLTLSAGPPFTFPKGKWLLWTGWKTQFLIFCLLPDFSLWRTKCSLRSLPFRQSTWLFQRRKLIALSRFRPSAFEIAELDFSASVWSMSLWIDLGLLPLLQYMSVDA